MKMCVVPDGDAKEITQVAMSYGDVYWELVSSSVAPPGRVLLCFKCPKS